MSSNPPTARRLLATFVILFSIAAVCAETSRCSAASFSCPHLPGTRLHGITAQPVKDYSTATVQNGNVPTANWTGLNFCNVTVTYSHKGYNDKINVQVWLPLDDAEWNGRFQGTGGGGYIAGLGAEALTPALAAGYATACTDAGLDSLDAKSWALTRRGQVNQRLLENFASTSLNELAMIGKAVTRSYFGEAPKHSYWTGCSTGGRQGMMLAQRYPTAFDGVLAMAPAINWPEFEFAEFWPQQVMNTLNYYPEACELEFLTQSAVEACDSLDGVQDEVISSPQACTFDPRTLVGAANTLCNGSRVVTSQAADIALSIWSGPEVNGEELWFGLNKDAPLAGILGLTLAETNCTGVECVGVPFPVSEEWIRLFVAKNKAFDTSSMSNGQYLDLFRQSQREYEQVIDTSDPNLELFSQAGGKILTWHGLADQLIMPNGTSDYYESVAARHAGDIADFYRVFFAPGTTHCAAGLGPYPYDALDALASWVEDGTAPDTLLASIQEGPGAGTTRELCPYPKVQVYGGGDPKLRSSFSCV